MKYAIGDPFTIYSEAGTKEIVLTGVTDHDVFYVYPDEPGRDQVFMGHALRRLPRFCAGNRLLHDPLGLGAV